MLRRTSCTAKIKKIQISEEVLKVAKPYTALLFSLVVMLSLFS